MNTTATGTSTGPVTATPSIDSIATRPTGILLGVGALLWSASMGLASEADGFGLASLTSGAAALVFQGGLIALVVLQLRTGAMGTGRVARVGHRIQLALLAGATVSTLLDMFSLLQGSVGDL